MFPGDFDAGMLLMEKNELGFECWPGEGRALRVGLVMDTAAFLQNLLGIFVLSQEWQQLLGTPGREGGSTTSVMRM